MVNIQLLKRLLTNLVVLKKQDQNSYNMSEIKTATCPSVITEKSWFSRKYMVTISVWLISAQLVQQIHNSISALV